MESIQILFQHPENELGQDMSSEQISLKPTTKFYAKLEERFNTRVEPEERMWGLKISSKDIYRYREPLKLEFPGQPKPWLPPKLMNLINKMKKIPLKKREILTLIEEIAKISIEFYGIKPGKFVAIDFNGRIVESADTEISLLLKVQGKEYKNDIFVWHVGSESFTGWRI